MSNEKIGGVAETMLQTLYARAKESKRPNHKNDGYGDAEL